MEASKKGKHFTFIMESFVVCKGIPCWDSNFIEPTQMLIQR